jgi:hypothetical protein
MKTRVMRYLGALGLGAALALSAATASFAGPHDPGCIPQYDSRNSTRHRMRLSRHETPRISRTCEMS